MTMAQLLAEFRLLVRSEEAAPSEVLGALNRNLVARSRRGAFCSLCYLDVDLARGVVRWANAGHPPAIRFGVDGARTFADPSGPPAGILEDVSWDDGEAELSPGDTLLLYTDGISEARAAGAAADVREFGIERLCELAGTLANRTPKDVVETVVQAVRTYCAPDPPHDDCTLGALRYRG